MNVRTAILLLFAVLCAGMPSLHAQSRHHFPNVVIIKYKTDSQIATTRSKTGIEPRNQVQQVLRTAGVSKTRPFLKLNRTTGTIRNKTAGARQARTELSRMFEIRYTSQADPALLAAKLSRMPAIEYAEPKYIRYMQFTPDDPVGNPQKDFHNFADAWEITRGSREVIIAIVDGGVGYTHPDLRNKLWINGDEIPAGKRPLVDQNSDGMITSPEVLSYLQQNNEDANGDGTITLRDAVHPNSSLTTGTDTDANGYEDDLFGWDFWAGGGIFSPVTEDNDPIHAGTDHGTHVAGIAAAETNNGAGIYGTGFNSRYMAVKAGGTREEPQAIGFGFEGIIYAVQQGADVINCSWGGGGFSEAENDVIEFATANGALVVGASGNESSDGVIFPAAYKNALAVGAVETSNTIASYSNYGFNLDVLATGSGIQSTVFNEGIGFKTGTSMSAPVVSGLAGLLKNLHPSWKPQRIATQIRSTAVSITDANSSQLINKLGKGKVDAFAAVNTDMPGLVIQAVAFENSRGEKLGLAEEGRIRLTITNFGKSTNNLVFDLFNLGNQKITLQETSKQMGTLATGESLEVSFGIIIDQNFDLSDPPLFKVNVTDANNNYSDFGILEYKDILFDVVAANRVKISLAGDGTIGFVDALDASGGVGFIPRGNTGNGFTEGDNLLFEGGLMVEIDRQMFDAVRDADSGLSKDFRPKQVFRIKNPSTASDLDGTATFTIGDPADVRHMTLNLETFVFNAPALSNVIYLKYTLQNPSSFVLLKNIYVGLFNDWDIGQNSSNNSISFSAEDSLLYVFDESDGSNQPLVAVAQLGNVSSLLAIDNAVEGRKDSVTFGLYDGFTDSEKLSALKAGITRTSAAGADVSAVAASGPFDLGPKATATVGFVYAFGESLNELRSQIEEARQQAPFGVSETGLVISEEIPATTRLFPNYPNPFNPTTQLRVDLEEPQNVTISVYDVLGRKVRVLVDGRLEARTHIFTFTADDLSSGVYFARLKTAKGVQTIPMTLIK